MCERTIVGFSNLRNFEPDVPAPFDAVMWQTQQILICGMVGAGTALVGFRCELHSIMRIETYARSLELPPPWREETFKRHECAIQVGIGIRRIDQWKGAHTVRPRTRPGCSRSASVSTKADPGLSEKAASAACGRTLAAIASGPDHYQAGACLQTESFRSLNPNCTGKHL